MYWDSDYMLGTPDWSCFPVREVSKYLSSDALFDTQFISDKWKETSLTVSRNSIFNS